MFFCFLFFFPSKTFLSERQPSTLLKSTTTLPHLSRPQYSPDLLLPHYFSSWDLLSSHILSFVLINYVYCLLSSQKHKLHKCRNLSLFINQCKHLKLLRIVSVFSTLKICVEWSHLISLLRTAVKFIFSMAAECWDCFWPWKNGCIVAEYGSWQAENGWTYGRMGRIGRTSWRIN